MEKKFIQFGIDQVEVRAFDDLYQGWIMWFENDDILKRVSPEFNNKQECAKWLIEELKTM